MKKLTHITGMISLSLYISMNADYVSIHDDISNIHTQPRNFEINLNQTLVYQTLPDFIFQPSDGSMTNGNYYAQNHTAQTNLYEYSNVIIIDGTNKTPTLTPQGTFIDQHGNNLVPIGSYNQPVYDYGITKTYYLFGIRTKKITDQPNDPIETYDSKGE